jgi:ubiquinone/menaquinone biosynthesis C-methylase UbiE
LRGSRGGATLAAETMQPPAHDDLYFERLGDAFDDMMSDYDVARRNALIFERLLPAGARWSDGLEVGCGTGRISARLVERCERLVVTDVSGVLAAKVGARLGCAARAADACALPFAAASFDLVVSSECIEHVARPLRALDEMARVLRPGGTLAVTTPNALWFPSLLVARALRLRAFDGPEHWISPRAARAWAARRGLVVRRFGGCHLVPWQVPGSRRVLPWLDGLDGALYPLMVNFGFAATRPGGER